MGVALLAHEMHLHGQVFLLAVPHVGYDLHMPPSVSPSVKRSEQAQIQRLYALVFSPSHAQQAG